MERVLRAGGHAAGGGAEANAALRQTLASPELQQKLAAQGTQLYSGAPEEYQRFIAAEKAKWAEIVKRADIKIE